MTLLHISQSKSRGISYLNVRQLCRSWTIAQKSVTAWMSTKSTYHNKWPRERFICFIRGAKWTNINQLNGPSPIHDTSIWLSQSIQSIRHVCCWLGMQKISLESASEELSAITISQQMLPSKLDACANVTTCCFDFVYCYVIWVICIFIKFSWEKRPAYKD